MFRPPADALKIAVIGKQWMWKVEYPGGQREINTLHVPMNRPVELVMTLRGRDPRFRGTGLPDQA